MARFMVKASEFKNVCKAVNDRQLESLKKEIIEILKKQDEKEFKKAINLFESQEMHYTHLEKSLISGKWIQKAGYGVGTVRIWKGKKYKKIAPGKWARVFDKEGRGTNIAIGKLIARVQKIDNVEDLMAFVMQNKQRFVDENGIDLPVLDKLRAAVDAKNNGGMGSKETSKPAEKKEDLEKYNKEMNERRAERQSAEYKEIVDKIPFENDSNKKIFLTGIKAMNISNDMKLDIADWFARNKIDGRSYADYLIEKVKEGYDKYESSSKSKGVSGKGALYKGNTGIPCDNKAAAYFAQFLAMAKDKGMEELKESEAEKTQNRSDAMKGNQNAKKYGLTDEQIERYDIQEVVEDVNGYGIVKNSEGKYSYIDDGRVKDRPDDFETSIEKVKERINDTYETKKNIQAAKDYDFANADFGPDVKYTKKNNGKHEYFKKSPDGSKAISVTIDVSDMREPLNMVYEVTDTKSGESWQYETAYGNKEGLEWAVERPEQMEKELKKFFKRDPNKEWEKMNSDNEDSDVTNIENSKSLNMDDKKIIAKSTKVADGKSSIPNTPEIKSVMKQLIASRDKGFAPGTYREALSEVYYDGENLVSTNGKAMKVVKVGKLEGIEPDSHVKIDISGKDNITIEKTKDMGRFPNYKRVIPDNHNQSFTLDNKLLRQTIEAMQRDGSFGSEGKAAERVSLEFVGDAIKIDGKIVGKSNGVEFMGDRKRVNVNPYLLLNALSNGEESIVTCGEQNDKAMCINTNVSTDVIMPMDGLGNIPDYEKNRKEFKASEEGKAELKAQREQEEAERATRKMSSEGKSEIIKNRPEGVGEDDYSSMIDFADDYYTKLGYDNTSARGMQQIKDMIDRAINRINAKDYEFLDSLENTDNKVSRKIFEMLTGEKVGTNRASAQKAWENWVGEEGVKAHKDKIAAAEKAEKDRVAAEKKAADDADREQYHGFLDGKTAAGKGKAKQILAKRARFDNKVYSYQELVDHYINELGGRVSSSVHTTSGGKDKTYYGVYDKEGRGFEIPKIVFDYGKHIQGDKGVEKSFIKDFIFLNEYEHDLLDEEDLEEDEPLFNDYSAEQPELFNSTEMKVQEAFNRCGCCL